MISTLPSVQYGIKKAHRFNNYGGSRKSWDKRDANRRHRRTLNRITRGFTLDPHRFDEETFEAPSLSAWDCY